MIQFEDIKSRCKAMSRLFNTPLVVAQGMVDWFHSKGVPVGEVKLNPYGYAGAWELIPVSQVDGIPPNEAYAYQIEVNGINMNAALAAKQRLLYGDDYAFVALCEEIGWKPPEK